MYYFGSPNNFCQDPPLFEQDREIVYAILHYYGSWNPTLVKSFLNYFITLVFSNFACLSYELNQPLMLSPLLKFVNNYN